MKHMKTLFGSRRKPSSSVSGVSEIIASLLLIAITVCLFSSIMFFVINMPSPQGETISDFKAQTGVSGSNFFINITHVGGQTLTNDSTGIYLFRDGAPTALYITSSSPGIGANWSIGSVWRYVTQYSPNMEISVMITNKQTNNIVWQSDLVTSTAKTPPILENRGLNPSPSYNGSQVVFYVVIRDLNGMSDISRVYVTTYNLTGVDNGIISLTDLDGDGRYTSASYTASTQWNGQMVVFTATYGLGMEVTGAATLSVIEK
jgi:flagellin-like protein